LIQADGFFAFNAFPTEVYNTLCSLHSSSKLGVVRNVGKSGTALQGTMRAAGARLAAGGIQGDSYGYYAYQTASTIAGLIELMDLALVRVTLS
jgi:hypothetical protein